MATSKSTAKRLSVLAKQDDAMDKKRGIKENSAADKKIDAQKGIPAYMRNGGKVGAKKKGR